MNFNKSQNKYIKNLIKQLIRSIFHFSSQKYFLQINIRNNFKLNSFTVLVAKTNSESKLSLTVSWHTHYFNNFHVPAISKIRVRWLSNKIFLSPEAFLSVIGAKGYII